MSKLSPERQLLQRLVDAVDAWRRSNEVSADSYLAQASLDIATRATALLAQPERKPLTAEEIRITCGRGYSKCGYDATAGRCVADGCAFDAQPERPQWTDTPPTLPGWYWYRYSTKRATSVAQILEVLDYGEGPVIPDDYRQDSSPISDYCGQWCGPIAPPEE